MGCFAMTAWQERVQIGNATLYLADCLNVLPALDKVDACITDPPYGIDFGKQGSFSASHGWGPWRENVAWDAQRPPRKIFEMLLRSASMQIIWGGNYFTDYLPPTMQWLVWDKGQDGFSLADFELAWSSQNKAARRLNYPRALALKDGKQHPTQKPLAVMRWCIEQAGHPQTILDPFMGSGTTGVACAQMGRSFIGIELERKYFDIACERIERAYAQGQLFDLAPSKPHQFELHND